ncbi:Argonaute siRNA chaperone complex subunit Arb1-domain-containing protein [Lophiotrema nucula]|uniref:Argonaute siRNA chaperone complex subunit Arb1-domain-containing protein n=1 Tax=Lophiotrema nucula TaxID=690887 RepID=A0A6A5ZTA9_9PLEO|nr:Argonaute siRNA chaperone complex subunit Arb1-domain-containing protein [Lophiotrema nucula]
MTETATETVTSVKGSSMSDAGSASEPQVDLNGDVPDGPLIRRQVEYYFSDENLPTDKHMLECCGGAQNLPVSVSRICGFKKMRKWKKKTVAQALRLSTFLDVVENGKKIRRRTPLVLPTIYDEPEDDSDIAYDPRTKREIVKPIKLLPQDKKALPPGMTKNMMKPTGFEPTHVEGPISPDDYNKERILYDPDKPFTERIEHAIQKFKMKKRMHEKYANVFNKWMLFGGVESMPRLFQGVSKEELAGMDEEQKLQILSIHRVPDDRSDPNVWAVDFVGVAEAFLSSFLPNYYGIEENHVKTACLVLETFFNYLLVHEVCDEYKSDLITARALCERAETELIKCDRVGLDLPGSFNTAASTIFEGSKSTLFTGNQEWAQQDEEDGGYWTASAVGMQNEQARVVFTTGLVTYGTDEQYDALGGSNASLETMLKNIKVLKREELQLEVTAVHFPTEDVRSIYTSQNEAWKSKLQLEPLGKLVCKSIFIDTFSEYDLPKDKYQNGQLPKDDLGKLYEFWVDDSILQDCFEGMKLKATVLTLDCGITILDGVDQCMVSFYRWLPNELWLSHKSDAKEFRLVKRGLEDMEPEEDEKVEINGEDAGGEEKETGDGEFSDDE